jgi:type IV pilus assembly protein PilW
MSSSLHCYYRVARAPRRDRGFTLIELLVGASVALFGIGLVLLTFLAQQRSFNKLDLARESSQAARAALTEMESSLRRAGFGVEPRYAIDMRYYNCGTVPCRDSATGPDELVFVARNPNYQWHPNGESGCSVANGCYLGNAWQVVDFTGTTNVTNVTIAARPGDFFHYGREVMITCANGASATMARVNVRNPTSGSVTAASNLQLQLMPQISGNPYLDNNMGASCYGTPGNVAAGVSLFLIDRYRYAITTFNGTPWLVLDTGLDLIPSGTLPDAGDLNNLIPIAQGVEDMQIAYALQPGTTYGIAAPDSNANWVIGDQAGTQEEPDPTPAVNPPPLYATPISDPSRYNRHPGNVHAIRISLGIRSLQSDPTQPGSWPGDPILPFNPDTLATFPRENRNAQPATVGRYKRFSVQSNVFLRNMDSRSPFIF